MTCIDVDLFVGPRHLHSGRPKVPRVSALIPTLNEARNLEHVLPAIPPVVDEVVIIDGCSTDDTVAVARRLRPDAVVVTEPRPGKGRALHTGLMASTGDILVMLDADGSTDPGEIPRFVNALLGEADFVKGSRFMHGGGTDDMERLRRVGNWALTMLVRKSFGGQYTDLCYGYNALWRDVLPYILDEEVDGFEIETHMNIRVLAAPIVVHEVPSFEWARIHGDSNLRTFRDGWRVLKTIMRERRRRTDELVIDLRTSDRANTPMDALGPLTPIHQN